MRNDLLKSKLLIRRDSAFSSFVITLKVICLSVLLFNNTVHAAEYVLDKAASKVKWEAKKVTGKHDGSISFANGSLTVSHNNISGGSLEIDMKSMVDEDLTNSEMNKKLMGHLASDDFFSIEKFPESKMVINKVTSVAGDEFHFLADLTIKGITNPVEFNARITIIGEKLMAEGIIIVNRTLYGIKFGSGSFFEGLGNKMIYDDFSLTFNVVANKN